MPIPTPDRWLPSGATEPTRLKKLLPQLGEFDLQLKSGSQPEHPTLSKWFEALSEPVRLPDKRVRWLGSTDLQGPPASLTERITVDKWFQPLAVPVRTPLAKRIEWQGDSNFLAPVINVAQWWQPLSEPVRVRHGLQHISRWLGDSELQLTAAQQKEEISPDRWWHALSLPRFDKPRNQHLYQSFAAPDELAPVSVRTQPQMQVIT